PSSRLRNIEIVGNSIIDCGKGTGYVININYVDKLTVKENIVDTDHTSHLTSVVAFMLEDNCNGLTVVGNTIKGFDHAVFAHALAVAATTDPLSNTVAANTGNRNQYQVNPRRGFAERGIVRAAITGRRSVPEEALSSLVGRLED